MAAAPDPSGTAAQLIGRAMSEGRAYRLVQSLTDNVGPRPAGSPNAARAVAWALETMKALGLKNVHTEKVTVPHWLRGEAEAQVTAPVRQSLHVTALGPSVATPAGGVSAEVVEVWSFDQLQALGDGARGKIVLFQHNMQRAHGFGEYGRAVQLRGGGASAAAHVGAVAVLVRSAGTGAFRAPHTGALHYADGEAKIPAAAIALEDADLLHRLLADGKKVRVHLGLTPREEAPVESANVVGEVPGVGRKDEIVLLGAHLDSWDLGTGAVDDGAGCAIVLDAARVIAAAARPPRRTVRVVLFMNEEMGLDGGRAYAERHKDELGKHVAALEADAGAGRPTGFAAIGGPSAAALLGKLAAPLATLGAATIADGDEAGADLTPLSGRVPLVGLFQDIYNYFDYHHTALDTFDKIDARDLAANVAAVAVVAYGLADAQETLPLSPPSKRVLPAPIAK